MTTISIEIPVRMWQLIDGCVDNSMAIDVWDDVGETAVVGVAVREEGWRAAKASTAPLDSLGWPPAGSLLAITLPREHWSWVIAQLMRWESVEEDLRGERREVRDLLLSAVGTP